MDSGTLEVAFIWQKYGNVESYFVKEPDFNWKREAICVESLVYEDRGEKKHRVKEASMRNVTKEEGTSA